MRIGEVAAKSGVSVQSIRFYERRGLIEAPPRAGSGYRDYPPHTPDLIRVIKRFQQAGLTLREILALFAIPADRAAAREIIEAKLREMDSQIRLLKRRRRAIAASLAACPCDTDGSRCTFLQEIAIHFHEAKK